MFTQKSNPMIEVEMGDTSRMSGFTLTPACTRLNLKQ
jgi:hypothetical protein